MKVIPRHFSSLNHHKPLGSMMLAGTAILGQLYCSQNASRLGQPHCSPLCLVRF